jgi:hypothetical protein
MTAAVARQLWTAVQSHSKAMHDSFRELDATDKELARLLQECSSRLFAKDDQAMLGYLQEHKAKTASLRQKFYESARAVEFTLEKARSRLEKPALNTDLEAEIDRLVTFNNVRGPPS